MKRYVAFLRGINVSGKKLIKMDVLKGIFVDYEYKNVVTYIQSGNVVFDADPAKAADLRAAIEKMLEKELGFEVVTIVRSIDEIKRAIGNNPFKEIDGDKKLYITYMSDNPAKENVAELDSALAFGEELHVRGKELFFVTQMYGNTKLSNTFIEKKLNLDATTRNMATTKKVITL